MFGLRRITRSALQLNKLPTRAMAFNACWEDTLTDAQNTIGRSCIVSPEEAQSFIKANEDAIVLDVRDNADEGIPGAVNISLGTLPFKADELCEEYMDPRIASVNKGTPIVVTCGLGGQALVAAKLLHDYGYFNLKVIEGGCIAWKNAGLATEKL